MLQLHAPLCRPGYKALAFNALRPGGTSTVEGNKGRHQVDLKGFASIRSQLALTQQSGLCSAPSIRATAIKRLLLQDAEYHEPSKNTVVVLQWNSRRAQRVDQPQSEGLGKPANIPAEQTGQSCTAYIAHEAVAGSMPVFRCGAAAILEQCETSQWYRMAFQPV